MIVAVVFKSVIFLRVLREPVPDLTTQGKSSRHSPLAKFLLQALASLTGGQGLVRNVFGRLRPLLMIVCCLWLGCLVFDGLWLFLVHGLGCYELFALLASQRRFTPTPHWNKP